MYIFINYLRVLAAILITNSHYGQVWPVADLAAGGLIGNILFFAISGFCLYYIKEKFFQYYCKRILRIYPLLVFFTLFTVLIGDYSINSFNDVVRLFIYPTNYIFIVWLMIAYALFYIIAYLSKKYDKLLEITFVSLIVVWLLTYLVFVEKSVYHIDNVSEPFILFLYFISMLMGALFRKHQSKVENGKLYLYIILLPISLVLYFGAKIAFVKINQIAPLQIVNQISILFVLYSIFSLFILLERKLNALPCKVNKVAKFLSGLTLHIYVVQFMVIRRLQHLVFPLNLVIVSIGIIVLAIVVYLVEKFIRESIVALIRKNKGDKQCKKY